MEQCLGILAQKANNKPLTIVGNGNQSKILHMWMMLLMRLLKLQKLMT